MGLKKFDALKKKECRICGKEVGEVSQTLQVCLDCLRSGKESVKPFIEKAYHGSRIPFRLLTTPPREALGTPWPICCKEVAEEAGLRRVRIGNLCLL